MRIELSIEKLIAAGADPDCEGVAAFRDQYGESAVIEWTRESQIEAIKGPLRRWLGLAWHWSLLPAWSMRGADLSYADLSGVNLSDANLRYANLSDANLRYANLRYAKYVGSDPEDVPRKSCADPEF